MQYKQKKYNIYKNTNSNISAEILQKHSLSLKQITDCDAPKVFAAEALPNFDYPKKQAKIIHLNAEKYCEKHAWQEQILQDIHCNLRFENSKKYAKSCNKNSFATAMKMLMCFLISTIFAFASFAIGSIFYKYIIESSAVFYIVCASMFAIFCLSSYLYYKSKNKKNKLEACVIKQLVKKPHLKKIIILTNMHRLNNTQQKHIFAFINSYLYFNPIYYIILSNSEVLQNFASYYEINEDIIVDFDKKQSQEVQDPQINYQIEDSQTQNTQQESQKDTGIIAFISNATDSDAATAKADDSINFDTMTAKALITSIQENALDDINPKQLTEIALQKFAKLSEKVFNEYMSILSNKVKKMDICKLDVSIIEQKALHKFVSYYKKCETIDFIMPLLDSALENEISDVILAFLPHLENDKIQQIREYVMQKYFTQNNTNLISLLKVLSNDNDDLCNFFIDKLSENPNLLYPAINELAEKMPEKHLQSIYDFLLSELKNDVDNTQLQSILSVISAYKERFRFLGLSTTNFNDIIFNKKYSSEQDKIHFIQDLLLSDNITDEEKTKYAEYLSHSCEDLSINSKMQVFTTLLKSGLSISKDTVITLIKDFENNQTDEYLEHLSQLIASYYNQKTKDESIFFDIACQSMNIELRSKILASALALLQNALVKLQKSLLQKLSSSDEELYQLDFDKVIMIALSKFCEHPKFPKNQLIDNFGMLLENQNQVQRYISLLDLFIIHYKNMSLNGDQKHDFKSAMFKAAANFNIDLSVITSCVIKVFKIEYISFVEQKIAKQGDSEVEEKVDLYLQNLYKEKE